MDAAAVQCLSSDKFPAGKKVRLNSRGITEGDRGKTEESLGGEKQGEGTRQTRRIPWDFLRRPWRSAREHVSAGN